MKFCDVGQHEVKTLWRSRGTNRDTGEKILSCCKGCMSKSPIKSTVRKKANKELNVFFAQSSLVFPVYCENCGNKLINTGSFTRRSQTCHILPKTLHGGFPSVASHLSNKVFMCCFSGCYGHSKWDNSDADTRKKMPVYKLAVDRFREFEHLLSEREKLKAYKYLGL